MPLLRFMLVYLLFVFLGVKIYSRTEKTICLAVSPSLKKYGIPGRARLFEVVQKVKQVNRSRKTGEPELSYIAAPPFGNHNTYHNPAHKATVFANVSLTIAAQFLRCRRRSSLVGTK